MNISVLKESQKLAHREARKGLTNCSVSNRPGWHCLGMCYCILVVSIQNSGAQQFGDQTSTSVCGLAINKIQFLNLLLSSSFQSFKI